VIGGMGADLILKIINQDLERFRTIPQIIVQANTKQPLLRQSMAELGFKITEEKVVLDGFFYIAQRYTYIGQKENLNEFQINFGLLLNLQDPTYVAYLNNELGRIKAILRTHPNSQKHKALVELLITHLNERVD
jgi:tRNA A22 N-methylase